MYVLSVDPGKMSGVCLLEWSGQEDDLPTWHKGGEGHANDAIRHALLKLVKSGWKPKVLLK
jgi:hypothetical protein